ncbi:MAG: enoyl-CoA hydratase/isomerase family protein [Ilumatobacteraceae bacterium]
MLEVERNSDGVAVVTLANGKVNALSRALVAALGEAADELTSDPPGAVVITGGERIFAAGADISEFGGAQEAGPITAEIHRALDAIAAIPRLVIASVTGLRPRWWMRVGARLRLSHRRSARCVRAASRSCSASSREVVAPNG